MPGEDRMAKSGAAVLLWAPRIAGILVALFLGLFALDAFDGRSFLGGLGPFAIHLIPTYIVLALVALSWRFEWVGAAAFFILALAYAVMVRWRLDWVAAISGPLMIVGVLFLLSWRYRSMPRAAH